MKACIHQPTYLPYLGFFDKILRTDICVIFDNAQYVKRSFMNRNKIRTPQGWQWLTVPVDVHLGQKICEVKIKSGLDWESEHWQSITRCYKTSKFFDEYKNNFEDIYSQKWEMLSELNTSIIKKIIDILDMDTKVVISSKLGELKSKSTMALIEICEKVGADEYLSGAFGRDYVEEDKFMEHNIKLEYQDYKHPVYAQNFDGFEPYMGIIDLLFNHGARTPQIIKNE